MVVAEKEEVPIKEPLIKTINPGPEQLQIEIEGLLSTEVIFYLLKVADQIASSELLKSTAAIKNTMPGANDLKAIN